MNQISQVLGRFGNIRRFDRVAVVAFGWMGIRCVAWSMTVSITMRLGGIVRCILVIKIVLRVFGSYRYLREEE